MDYAAYAEPVTPKALKIIVAGGFGVGKTTTVASISEIEPLTTEAEMTELSIGVDNPLDDDKSKTTVALDFGRVTIDDDLRLYLFGTPGQDRFGFLWDTLIAGALGAVVIVDSRRIEDSHAAVDYFEQTKLPMIIAVNAFNGRLAHDLTEVRWALAIADSVPVIAFDARNRSAVRDTLLVLLDRALAVAYRAAG